MKKLLLLLPFLIGCGTTGFVEETPSITIEVLQVEPEAIFDIGFQFTTECEVHGSHTGVITDRQFVRMYDMWLYLVQDVDDVLEDSWLDEGTLLFITLE